MFAAWLAVALVGTVAMWVPRNRQRFSLYQSETFFAPVYTLFFLSYSYLDIVVDFARFLILVMAPLLFFIARLGSMWSARALGGSGA
jgi:hypothetical protein